MKYEAGNRFTPETYLKTEAESGTSVSLKVTGELEGVEVSFDSGDVPEITSLSVTENGTYEAPEGTAYDPVTVEVPNSYTAADEGKVVSSGALVSQTSTTKTANGTYDTTLNNEVVVAVPGPSGSINITQNDTYDVTNYASAVVNVGGGSSQDTLSLQLLFSGNTVQTTQDLIIPESFTSMRARCMQNYTSSVNLILPSTMTVIEDFAAYNATGIQSITCKAVTPPSLGTSSGFGGVPIYVPAESVEAYKAAANWSSYASNIQAIPTT